MNTETALVLLSGGLGFAGGCYVGTTWAKHLQAKWFQKRFGKTQREVERQVDPLKRRPVPPFTVSHPRQPYTGTAPRLRSAVFRGNSREERRGEVEE